MVFIACGKDNDPILLFSINDDIALGARVNDQIRNDTTGQFPIINEDSFPEAYIHIRRIFNLVISSPEIKYRDRFAYDSIKIINADVLNAFATPGGYVYVYTGLINYLDSEDHLAGVLGHEAVHAERRHSSRQIQNQYGIAILASILLGNDPGTLSTITAQIAGTLGQLSFSRKFESESDDYSVRYLSSTNYACNGAAGFFRKLEQEGRCNSNLVWLSTHPDPCDRVDAIDQKAQDLGCKTQDLNPNSYQQFKNSLP